MPHGSQGRLDLAVLKVASQIGGEGALYLVSVAAFVHKRKYVS